MEGSCNGKPNEQDGDSLGNDWRTQHEPDLRETVILAVVERLEICFHQLSENDIMNTAFKFEGTIYGMATDKEDYLWKISRKVLGIHTIFIIVSSDNGANTTPDPDYLAYQTLNQGQSLPTSLPHTQTMFQHQMDQQLPYMQHPQQEDWREETYQKIKALKEKYVLVLNALFQTLSDRLRQIDSLPQQKKLYAPSRRLRLIKAMLEQVLVFLNVCKSSVSEFHRDRFSRYERRILSFTEFHQKVIHWKMQRQQLHQQPQTNHQQLPNPMACPANQIQTESQEHPPLVTLPPGRPIDRLIKAIQSSSPESLAQSVSEMSGVISSTDKLDDSVYTIGGACLGEDLSERTSFPGQQGDTNPTKRFKRSVTAMPLDSKVNKTERYALLQEIIEINGRLVETVVSLCNEDVCPSEVTSGLTAVMCTYVPVALSATFKDLYNSGHISQIQPLRLLVPESYPCSPIILEKDLFDTASVHKHEDLSARARTRFGFSMREYSEPISLIEIAKVWDECARATMVEYAERHGGGTFNSKYGHWESLF